MKARTGAFTSPACWAVLLGFLAQAPQIRADDSVQPYIDQLKQGMKPDTSSPGSESYTEKLKKRLSPSDASGDSSEGYTERLKQANPLMLQGTPGSSYTDEEKKKLAPKQEGGAIDAVRSGNSDLQLKKPGSIHNAFGLRVGLGLSRTVTAASGVGTGVNFNTMYGANWAPDVSLYGEHQFFHSEILGSLGVFGMTTVGFFSGSGQFEDTALRSAVDGSLIPPGSTNVSFRFYEVPLVAGLDYRFNLMKYLRPYVMGGPTVIGFSETRSDAGQSHSGISKGAWGGVGLAVLMDWVSPSNDWDRYDEYGIKHAYLTVEYSYLYTLPSSPVTFNISGVYAGFMFEL